MFARYEPVCGKTTRSGQQVPVPLLRRIAGYEEHLRRCREAGRPLSTDRDRRSGPNLSIAQDIHGNQFTIAGGTPGTKVSWQVTGIRHDPYANAHRIPVEEDKAPPERGKYLYPTEYGQPPPPGHPAGLLLPPHDPNQPGGM